jgi:tetratricopeptide (TPR) repeat protein
VIANQAFRAETQNVESVWAELKLHLERSKGFCLVFLCSDSPGALDWLRVRLNDAWVWRTAPSVLLRPESANGAATQVLGRLQAEVSERPAVRSPVWVDLASVDSAAAPDWDTSRGEVMSRLNEWRSWLQGHFKRPLVFALPLAWRRRMPEVAPDLWHVRTFSAGVADLDAYDRFARSEWLLPDIANRPSAEGPSAYSGSVEQLLERGAVDAALEQAGLGVIDSRHAIANGGGLGSQRALAIALFKLGYAQRHAGRDQEALASYGEAIATLRSLRVVLGDSHGVLRDLAVGLSKFGDAQRHFDQTAEAVATYEESVRLWRTLHLLDPAAMSAARDLAVILTKYGNALNETGQSALALEPLSESVETCRAVRQQSHDAADALDDLAMSLDFLSIAQRRAGNLAAALASCNESIALRRQLAGASNSRESIRNLAVSLGRAGEFHRQARNGGLAVESYRESVDLFRALHKRLGEDPVVLQNLASSLVGLGESQQLALQHEAASAVFDESVAIFRALKTSIGPTVGVLRDLASALMYLADATADLGKPNEAISLYLESLSVVSEAEVSHGSSPWMRLRVADCTQKVGVLQSRLGNTAEATQTLEQVVSARRMLAAEDDSIDAQRDVFVALGLLGDAYLQSGSPAQALTRYEESIFGFRLLARRLGNSADALLDLQRTLVVAGEAHQALGDAGSARAKFQESLELARQVRQLLGDFPGALEALADSLERLACLSLHQTSLEVSQSNVLAQEAVCIRERLTQAFPTDPRYQQALDRVRGVSARLTAEHRG